MGAKIGYYIFALPLSYLPLSVLYLFTDFFYLIIISVFPYRKKVIDNNLLQSFPAMSTSERKKIRRKFYRHFTDLLAEGIKNLSISENDLRKRMKVTNPILMSEQYHRGRNVILVSGHYNNWEWLVSGENLLFDYQAVGIGMPMTSKFWDKKVNERRSRFGMKVVHAKNYREELKKLKDTLVAVLVLSDQSPGDGRKAYWMNFLNQPTPVLFGAELMAHELDYSVVFFATRKVRRGFYEITLDLITNEPDKMTWGAITEAHTQRLEKLIEEHPEYWLWSHKRWKRELPEDIEELKVEQREKFNKRFNL